MKRQVRQRLTVMRCCCRSSRSRCGDACSPLLPYLKQQLIISIAAGLRLADVSRWLGGYGKVVRAMPNTPALIGCGVTGLCAMAAVSMAERLGAERILQAVGSTLWIADEEKMDAVTRDLRQWPGLCLPVH
jgi:pyrroline-5-carboxylate reductase